MKGQFKFKILLLVAVLATAFLTCFDASASSSVMHFANLDAPWHVSTGIAMASLAVVPLATFVKDNCSISITEIASLTAQYGKIKILTVMIEPPTYDESGELTDNGEFYSYAVKRPDAGMVRMLMNYAKQGKTDDYINSFIKNLVVAGDTEALSKDGLIFLGFSTKIDEFLKPYESFLSKA